MPKKPPDTLVIVDEQTLVSIDVFRRYPTVLYTYLVGAIGLAVSTTLTLQSTSSAYALPVGISALVLFIGHRKNKRYMTLADAAIRIHSTPRITPTITEEEPAHDASN